MKTGDALQALTGVSLEQLADAIRKHMTETGDTPDAVSLPMAKILGCDIIASSSVKTIKTHTRPHAGEPRKTVVTEL